jgi:hypothetical protein
MKDVLDAVDDRRKAQPRCLREGPALSAGSLDARGGYDIDWPAAVTPIQKSGLSALGGLASLSE